MSKYAVISHCRRYRYRLGRRWGDGLPLLYVMLNPSTADAEADDPTIRRCIGFAKAHGFGAIDVVNLFAFRATNPADLLRAVHPVGPDNNWYITLAAREAGAVCVAWGANARESERPSEVLPLIRDQGHEPFCLSITKHGHPGHPLMLPNTSRLQPFTLDAIDTAMLSTAGRN